MPVEIKARLGDAEYQSRCKVDEPGAELVDNAWLTMKAVLVDMKNHADGCVNWGLSG